jgi:hypothetical protein
MKQNIKKKYKSENIMIGGNPKYHEIVIIIIILVGNLHTSAF